MFATIIYQVDTGNNKHNSSQTSQAHKNILYDQTVTDNKFTRILLGQMMSQT